MTSQVRAGHVASRGGKSCLSNKPIFPQPHRRSEQHNAAKNPKLTQVEHTCSGNISLQDKLTFSRTLVPYKKPFDVRALDLVPFVKLLPAPAQKSFDRKRCNEIGLSQCYEHLLNKPVSKYQKLVVVKNANVDCYSVRMD